MTANMDFDRILEGWLLDAGPAVPNEAVVQGALDAVRTTPRRRGLASTLFGPRPWPAARRRSGPVGLPSTRLVAAELVLIALIATALVAGGVAPPAPIL